MRGFCKSGIMLLPKHETWNNRGVDYQLYLKRSLAKAVEFFGQKGIQLECFTTDEMANILRPEGVEWVASSAPEDVFFIRRNVDGFSTIQDGKEIDDVYADSRKKYPAGRGLEVEDRFSIVEKRDKFSANKYIEKQKFVLTFEHPQNPYYKIKYKEGDGRIIMRVSHTNFLVSCIMSGNPIDLTYIVEYNGSTKPLHMWEV
jgi:hypothetical protein